jgi:hypothetical protein
MLQLVDVEDPTNFTMYDAYDVGSISVIAPTLDEDSTPNISYDVDDDENMIVIGVGGPISGQGGSYCAGVGKGKWYS